MDADTFAYVAKYINIDKLREILYNNPIMSEFLYKETLTKVLKYMIENGHKQFTDVIAQDNSIYYQCCKLGLSKQLVSQLVIRKAYGDSMEEYLIPYKPSTMTVSQPGQHMLKFFVYNMYLGGETEFDAKTKKHFTTLLNRSLPYSSQLFSLYVRDMPEAVLNILEFVGNSNGYYIKQTNVVGIIKAAILYKNKPILDKIMALSRTCKCKINHILPASHIRMVVNNPSDINRVLLSEEDYIYWWICCYRYNEHVFYHNKNTVKRRVINDGINYDIIIRYIETRFKNSSDEFDSDESPDQA